MPERDVDRAAQQLLDLVAWNRRIHDLECVNLDPAANVMNPAAEALLARGLGSRPSLGLPGAKYETGLEAIERIELLADELAREVFGARHVELRVASGAMANLCAFMATCRAGDPIVVPPASIGGHVTHHRPGAAGWFGLEVHEAPVDPDAYSVDVEGLAALCERVRPRLITLGGSMNLHPHPVAEVRRIADAVGAHLLYDAAHVCGLVAGGAWPNPLAEGAHLVTMSTYKSLAGPPSGMVLTDDDGLAERLRAIAYPGLTANFDAGKTAALAMTLLDWMACGPAYARAMVDTAAAMGEGLAERGLPVFRRGPRHGSHQLALEAGRWGGGQAMAARLRRANLLACGIGLPVDPVPGDTNGLRLGTPEVARWGMQVTDMDELAGLLARALHDDPDVVALDTMRFRQRFTTVHFVRP